MTEEIHGFTEENLYKFIMGHFDQVDEVDSDALIERFMIPILTEYDDSAMLEYCAGHASLAEDWVEYALDHSFVGDSLVELSDEQRKEICITAQNKYREALAP